MTSVFSRIIAGELPARFVWRDELVVGFLSIAPLTAGHTLVVPRTEIDQWTDAEPELLAHCTLVAQTIGAALKQAWSAPRAGLIIAGFEIAHLHLHVLPAWGEGDFDFHRADPNADPAGLDADAARLRTALRTAGAGAVAD